VVVKCPTCGHDDPHYYSIGVGDDKLGCQHEGCKCVNFLVFGTQWANPSMGAVFRRGDTLKVNGVMTAVVVDVQPTTLTVKWRIAWYWELWRVIKNTLASKWFWAGVIVGAVLQYIFIWR
jgi:hypothetical protein